jgi:hypothetical protein
MRIPRYVWISPLLMVGLGVVAFLIPPPDAPSPVNRENFDRIQRGMTHDEVTAILGEETDHATRRHVRAMSGVQDTGWWWGDEGTIVVGYTRDDSDITAPRRVTNKKFIPMPPNTPRETYGDRWCRQLGL